MRYVIIGNSAAGVSAVEGIRSVDKKGTITVISADPQVAYSPALTTYYISGKTKEKNIYLKDKNFYKDNNVQLKSASEAVTIDPKKRTVTTKPSSKVSYDKLLIAMGAKPVIPPVKGVDQKGVFALRSLNDAKAISKYAENRDKVLIIGGGLVGLRAAYALSYLGKQITIVELSSQILPQNLDKEAASIVQSYLEEKGWEIITGKYVKELAGNNGAVSKALLSDGSKIDASLVIIGTGVRPDTAVAEEAGVLVDQGIVVDEKMAVTVKGVKDAGIYAAGDIVEAYDTLLGKKAINAIWPLARAQGYVAGKNMAGESVDYEGGFPMNSIDFFGLTAMSVGRSDLRGTKFFVKKAGRVYRKIGIRNNKLVFFTLVKNVENAGILTSLIKEKVDIRGIEKELMNEDFGLISLPEHLRRAMIAKQFA